MHDWTFFQITKVERDFIKGNFLSYKLIKDYAYPDWPWIYSPFRSCAEGFGCYKTNWSFIQSSTRICAECTFKILKRKWRIIMKNVDKLVQHMVDVVATCILIHNLYIIGNDSFDID